MAKSQNEKSPFRHLLLNKCQSEFEREKKFEVIQREKEEEIERAETDEKRKALQTAFDELASKEKRRVLGTIKYAPLHFVSCGGRGVLCVDSLANSIC